MRPIQPKPAAAMLTAMLALTLPGLAACSASNDSPIQDEGPSEEIWAEDYVEPTVSRPADDPEASAQKEPEAEAPASQASVELPPRAKAAEDGAQLVGEEYSIKIPEGDERFFDITYDNAWEEVGDGIYYGYEGNVMVTGEEPWNRSLYFRVAVYSDNWAPEGEFYALSLGHPSNRGDATVYVVQPMYRDESYEEVEDTTADFASWITVF